MVLYEGTASTVAVAVKRRSTATGSTLERVSTPGGIEQKLEAAPCRGGDQTGCPARLVATGLNMEVAMAYEHAGRTLAVTGLAGAGPAALRADLARLDTAQLVWPSEATAAGERILLAPLADTHLAAGILTGAAYRAPPGYRHG